MVMLKKSLGQGAPEKAVQPKRKKAADDVRQTGLKLPIRGGKAAVEKREPQAVTKPSRKRA
jgi:hypothetical protein